MAFVSLEGQSVKKREGMPQAWIVPVCKGGVQVNLWVGFAGAGWAAGGRLVRGEGTGGKKPAGRDRREETGGWLSAGFRDYFFPQHCLYFRPEPQGQGALRETGPVGPAGLAGAAAGVGGRPCLRAWAIRWSSGRASRKNRL